jgi:hypothetical protein
VCGTRNFPLRRARVFRGKGGATEHARAARRKSRRAHVVGSAPGLMCTIVGRLKTAAVPRRKRGMHSMESYPIARTAFASCTAGTTDAAVQARTLVDDGGALEK